MVKQTNETNLWWLMAVAGFATVIFGLVAVFWPGLTLGVFILLFAGYVLVAGLIAMARGFVEMSEGRSGWWLSLLLGILAVGVGIYLVRHPQATFLTVIVITGLSFIVQGIVDVARGLFTDAPSSTARIMVLIGGALSIVVGVFLLNQPATAGIAFVWLIGLYALIAGPLMVAASFDMRRLTQKAA